MNHNPTVLEIHKDALKYNLEFFRSRTEKNIKFLAVVKASGYGSDALMVGKYLEKQGVDYFAVAYADEGLALREAGIKTPILVLHPQINNLKVLIEYNLEPNLYSWKILDHFLIISKELGLTNYPVHLKFNTGLNRLGFQKGDLTALFTHLGKQENLYVKSIFSHLVASEDSDFKQFTINQINEFKDICTHFYDLWGYLPLRHMTNTSGILNFPEAHFDMVRLGLGLYGFANEDTPAKMLKNVLRLKSVISQIHTVKKGQSVGYNMGFKASSEKRTATIPIGHADGIFRSLGLGKMFVKIGGKKAPIIGNICMDMIMADVSGINCEEGDEVIIIDNQQDVLDLARNANTISYEILTALSDRIKRVII